MLRLDQYSWLGHGVGMSVRVIRLTSPMMMVGRVGREVGIRVMMVGMTVMLFRVLDRQVDLLLLSLQCGFLRRS